MGHGGSFLLLLLYFFFIVLEFPCKRICPVWLSLFLSILFIISYNKVIFLDLFIFFLICFWTNSLLVDRKATDFCVLILCPDTLDEHVSQLWEFSIEVFRVLSIGSLQLGKSRLPSLFIFLYFSLILMF